MLPWLINPGEACQERCHCASLMHVRDMLASLFKWESHTFQTT